MKKILFSSFVFCFLSGCPIQTIKAQHLNFDFEEITKGLPAGWQTFGSSDYAFGIDSSASQHGKVCAFISYSGKSPGYKACSFSIPAKYSGKKITLTGYLKTENVSDGWAGLWMRIDPEVSFDNMQKRGVTGTTGWKKYSITLDLDPKKAQQIVVGGLLTGKGKLWIDNLQISIDGRPLSEATAKKMLPAQLDTTFNKRSAIDTILLNGNKVEDLKTLGMIWSFLKYYHPSIAAGNYNWDFELFRLLPRYLDIKNQTERDALLTEWIAGLGELVTEKSGVLNLGVEGMMLVGAIAGFATADATGSAWLGVVVAAAAGAAGIVAAMVSTLIRRSRSTGSRLCGSGALRILRRNFASSCSCDSRAASASHSSFR